MEDRNLHKDGTIYSLEYFFSKIHEWAVENIINSTANASHFNTLGWLDSMIRRAASKVPLLHNKMQSVAYYNVAKLKHSRINHDRQLTDLQKMKVGRAFPCLEINPGQTFIKSLKYSSVLFKIVYVSYPGLLNVF